MNDRITRLNVNINEETRKIIEHNMIDGISATETIRRAISVYSFLIEEEKQGHVIKVKGPDSTKEITLL